MVKIRHRFLAATSLVLTSLPGLAAAEVSNRVGVTSAVNQDASARLQGGITKTIAIGDEVIHNQVINTSNIGLVQILLADGTAFTVGPNSSLTIDNFVYDPAAGTAKVSASLSKGFMRFIGGRTSKTEDGATIRTPIGTAGIRGAVVDIDLGNTGQQLPRDERGRKGKNGERRNPPHVSMIFGREVVLTSGGLSNRIFQAGYSIVVDGDQRYETRTPETFLQDMQDRLAGRDGTHGGVRVPPNDQQVADSGIERHNSASPIPYNVPVPVSRPDGLPGVVAASEARNAAVENAARPVVVTVPRSDSVRVLTLRAPGSGDGIIGGDAGSERTGTLAGNEGSTGTATLSDNSTLSLPIFADSTGLTVNPVSVTTGNGTYTGNAYVGRDGFRAYLLSQGTDPLYIISGTATPNVPSVFSTSGTRHYALTADPLTGLVTGSGTTIPFADATRLASLNLSGAVSSDLLMTGTPDDFGFPSTTARGLQAWLVIDGTGASQKSAIGIMTGEMSGSGTAYGFTGQRGGSDRLDASDGSTSYSGEVASAPVADGGSGVFGANGDYMVLTNAIGSNASSYHDEGNHNAMAPTGGDFSTTHVASLTSIDTNAARSYAGQTIKGYSAIAITRDNVTTLKSGTSSFSFNGDRGTFSATFQRFDTDSNPYNDEIGFTDAYGGAVYVDDQNFASAGANNRNYVVSAKTVPAKIFDGGTSAELCQCAYMSWGWWGSADVSDGYTQNAHMGNWVIGDITANVAMPSSGQATYTGHAVGTVLSGSSQYIATGNMSATMDFGARTGNVAFSNFDGHAFDSNVSFASSSTFTGTNGATALTGSFVNNGATTAQGIMGSFATSASGWSASGIFGGNRN